MTKVTTNNLDQHHADQYQSNMPRHIIALSRYLQSETMHRLKTEGDHPDLRLSFEPFIGLIGHKGCRLTDLATILGISKQACNQTANEIEQAGYLQRQPDANDGRAKILILTERGHQLARDGIAAVSHVQKQFSEMIGSEPLAKLISRLAQLHDGLQLPYTKPLKLADKLHDAQPSAILGALLPRLTSYMMQQLMARNIARGHGGLKLSYGQVLTLISPNGGRIQQIAAINEVSKQTISAIANDLQKLGYIQRNPDPLDARQVLFNLTDRGKQLITDSVKSIEEMEAEFAAIIGEPGLQQIKKQAQELYYALRIEQEVFEPQTNLEQLAHTLKSQLGPEQAMVLAQLLQTDSSDETRRLAAAVH